FGNADAMTMIDAHQHFWKYDPHRHDWINDDMRVIQKDFTPPDLAPLLAENGFEGCVLVQVDQTEEETRQLLAWADEFSFIRGVVGWIDLCDSALDRRLEHYAGRTKLKGFRHIIQGEQPGFMDRPELVRGVRKLHESGYTFDLLIYHHQLEEALRFVRQIPDTPIVVDHIAKPSIATGEIQEWERHIRAMAALPNVCCKVSGMVTEANWSSWRIDDFLPYLECVADAFGADRLMYGSDWPVCLVAATYGEQLNIVKQFCQRFSQEERNMILDRKSTRLNSSHVKISY